jgi:predicted  nucleic acid-binding Zn-ribbon protein
MALTKEEQSLLAIQEIDIKLGQVSDRLENAPHKQRITTLRAKVAEGEKRLELIENARTDLEKKVNALQLEVDDFNERMQAHQASMQKSINHREVEGLSKELETLMKQKEKRENDGMKLMEKRSNFGDALTDTAEKTQQLKAVEVRELAAYKEYYQELKAVYDVLQEKRKELLANVDATTMKKYEQIKLLKNGIGVALFDADKCGGCQVMIPAAKCAEIETADSIVTCPSCKRLLVVER